MPNDPYKEMCQFICWIAVKMEEFTPKDRIFIMEQAFCEYCSKCGLNTIDDAEDPCKCDTE